MLVKFIILLACVGAVASYSGSVPYYWLANFPTHPGSVNLYRYKDENKDCIIIEGEEGSMRRIGAAISCIPVTKGSR